MRWRLGFGQTSPRHEEAHRAETAAAETVFVERTEMPATVAAPLTQLDAMGQRGEMLRVRIAQLEEKLEEVKNLPADFAAIVDPLAAITAELPKARVRNAELEGLLARERDLVGDLRRQLAESTARANASSTELLSAQADLARTDARLRERETEVDELRGSLAERTQVAGDLDRQLAAEAERARALLVETKTLRAEVQTLDQALTRASSDLAEGREHLALFEQEGRRLQVVGEERATRILDLEVRIETLMEESGSTRERLHAAEDRLTAEIAAREKVEAQAHVELSTLRGELGNLTMRVETASSRATALDRLLGQTRAQLREREEAVRAAERSVKEAEAERLSQGRRWEVAQAELARASERLGEAQQSRTEHEARADMLAKALSAKDSALEQALARAAALADQAEQSMRRNEIERAELEGANRRLTEELHNERSERALARGALDIARESRATLQKQYEALRRSGRTLDAPDPAPGATPARSASADGAPSNVRAFPPQDRG